MISEGVSGIAGEDSRSNADLGMQTSKNRRSAIAPQIPNISLAELDSLIEPLTRPKIEYFSEFEIQLMLEEIGKLRHIILSKETKNGRLLKKAWDEVAHNMAQRFPTEYKRTSSQIKRKWKQILTKAGRTVREGQGQQEVQIDRITAMVAEFLASTNSNELPVHKTEAPFNSIDTDVAQTEEFEAHPSNTVMHFKEELTDDDDDTDNESSSDVVMVSHTLPEREIFPENASSDSHLPGVRLGRVLHNELIRQSRAEHALRMEILRMKRRYWQIKMETFCHNGQTSTVNGVHFDEH